MRGKRTTELEPEGLGQELGMEQQRERSRKKRKALSSRWVQERGRGAVVYEDGVREGWQSQPRHLPLRSKNTYGILNIFAVADGGFLQGAGSGCPRRPAARFLVESCAGPGLARPSPLSPLPCTVGTDQESHAAAQPPEERGCRWCRFRQADGGRSLSPLGWGSPQRHTTRVSHIL